jgi:hypothetical protein
LARIYLDPDELAFVSVPDSMGIGETPRPHHR